MTWKDVYGFDESTYASSSLVLIGQTGLELKIA